MTAFRILLFLLATTVTAGPARGQAGRAILLETLPSSTLAVQGTSNLTDFTCRTDRFRLPGIVNTWPAGDGSWTVREATLSVAVGDLDCGIRKLNRDMAATLKADLYPDLRIRVLRVLDAPAVKEIAPSWRPMDFEVRIAIAGQEHLDTVRGQIRQTDEEMFQFVGSHEIRLSTYCLDPPRTLLGLVRVADCVVLEFDLAVRATDPREESE